MRKEMILTALCILTSVILFANPANLTIKLNGYNSQKHKNFADIKLPNVNYPYSEQIKISESGIINTSWLVESTQEIIFAYEGKEVSMIISPNDNVAIAFRIEDLHGYGNEIDAKVSGLNQETNELIYEYGHLLDKWISNSSTAFGTDIKLNRLEYQSLREKEREGQLEKLERLIQTNKVTNPLFLAWATSKINYSAGIDYCLYPFMGKINKTINEKDEYFKFVDKLNPSDEFVLHLSSYTEYLKALISSLGIIGNISNSYTQERNNLKEHSFSYFPIHFKIVSETMSGKQREIALTQLYLTSKDIPFTYLDSLNNYLRLDNIQQIKRDDFEGMILLSLLDDFDLREEEKKPLKDIYESAKGKLILHDFWFIGCAPCMKELPHYNKLIEESGDEIEYIFFGIYMEEGKWKEKINELNLKGRHHLLTKNQIAFFERYFKLTGFPHHQIVDKEGKIRDDGFPRVLPENFELILDRLEKIKNGD